MSKTTENRKEDGSPKFVFVGDPQDNYSGPNVLIQHGVRFVKNKPIPVPPELAPKFEKHTHFLTPAAAEKLQDRLLAAQQADDDDDFEDEEEDAPPRRPLRGAAPKGSKAAQKEGGGKDYEGMTMAQLHMEVAEQNKTAKGDATKEELIALLKGE